MPLDPNKFTRKTGEALGAAQALAREQNHSQVTPAHVLAALVAQPESVVIPVLERLGVSTRVVRDRIDEEMAKLPQVYGQTAQQAQLSPDAFAVFEAADAQRAELGDDYLSTEHVLLAMSEIAGGIGDVLRALGQVQRVFFERFALAFGLGRLHVFAAAHGHNGRLERLARQALLARQLAGVGLVVGQRQQHHFARHELVAALLRFLVGQVQHVHEFAADLGLAAGARHLGQAFERAFQGAGQAVDVHARTLQQRARAAVVLVQQRGQHVDRLDILVIVAYCQALRIGNCFLQLGGHLILAHGETPWGCLSIANQIGTGAAISRRPAP